MHSARPQHDPVGERPDPLATADEDVTPDQAEGVGGKPSATLHVVEDVVYADVHPGEGVVTGHGPPNVGGQEV
jgi:hypothetical protein